MHDPLFQVWATRTDTGELVPVPFFPRVVRQVADEFVTTMRAQIATGNEKRFAEPQALVHLSTL
jgi:hypothetical protein